MADYAHLKDVQNSLRRKPKAKKRMEMLAGGVKMGVQERLGSVPVHVIGHDEYGFGSEDDSMAEADPDIELNVTVKDSTSSTHTFKGFESDESMPPNIDVNTAEENNLQELSNLAVSVKSNREALPLHKQNRSKFSNEKGSSTKNIVKASSAVNIYMRGECGMIGLRNLGNTCFMNSIIQCLSYTVPLTTLCLGEDLDEMLCPDSRLKGMLVTEYRKLIASLWEISAHVSITPRIFKTQIGRFAPQFTGYQQQDSQEFLRFLIDALHDDLSRIDQRTKFPPEDPKIGGKSLLQQALYYRDRYSCKFSSPILDLFSGQLRSALSCTKCGHISYTWDQFCDLSVPIPDVAPDKLDSRYPLYHRTDRSTSITLYDCLERFCAAEVLDGDEKPTCAKCKARRRCTKSLRIEALPPVLVIHLKRFSFLNIRGSKITKSVSFPREQLSLNDYCTETSGDMGASYSLYAVSNHMGSLRGGHYTAFCRHPVGNRWCEFDDHHVQLVDENRICGPEAYVLFYIRDLS